MECERAERGFRELKSQYERGRLDEAEFRVQVAKLTFQDEQGTFWMIDADDGTWFCNRGECWEAGDPHAQPATGAMPQPARRPRRWRRLAWAVPPIVLVALAAVIVLQPTWLFPRNLPQPTPTTNTQVEVTIASPADGSQVALDQEVAIESTLYASAGLQATERVELRVDGQTVDAHAVRSRVQPGQTSLPLSQPWLPSAEGEHEVAVVVLSPEGDSLGKASITLEVAAAPNELVADPACKPDALLLADVTIPSGMAFRPGSEMDKVWQVRNSGTCAWGAGYALVRRGGETMEGGDSLAVPPTAAGEPADLAVTLQAPSEAGTYTNTWQLRSPEGVLFGPLLSLEIEVKAQAEEGRVPGTPAYVEATVTEDGQAVRLTWKDQSDNEDAFRIYREDIEASIGLVPANTQLFVDKSVTCGNTYRYELVAFNAVGASPLSETAEVQLARCVSADMPPTLTLTVVPTQVLVSGTFTVTFHAADDVGVVQVTVWGEDTGNALLGEGRTFPCAGLICGGSWTVTETAAISTSLTILAVARDSSGQDSEPARVEVTVRPPR
jgi:Ig-like domain from next to BRCA1 gene